MVEKISCLLEITIPPWGKNNGPSLKSSCKKNRKDYKISLCKSNFKQEKLVQRLLEHGNCEEKQADQFKFKENLTCLTGSFGGYSNLTTNETNHIRSRGGGPEGPLSFLSVTLRAFELTLRNLMTFSKI